MDIHVPEDQNIEEPAHAKQLSGTEGIRIFGGTTWIPAWKQSTPGKSLTLGSVPTSCNLYLEPEPHIAIEIKLEGQEALQHHSIVTHQGEYVPMQFDGLKYNTYPIRGNQYCTFGWGKDKNFYLRAKYRLLDKGLRLLRITDNPIWKVQGFIINLAIDNYEPLTIVLGEWTVTISHQKGEYSDDSRFKISHEITIANKKGPFSEAELEAFRDHLRLVLSLINIRCCEIVLTQTFDDQFLHNGYMIDQLHCDDYTDDLLVWTTPRSQRDKEIGITASKIYGHLVNSPPHYLEGLGLLTCNMSQSIPSLWTVLEKICGSGPHNIRDALEACVDSINIPSEYIFLKEKLDVAKDADFIDVFYGMRNHFAHAKNKIARGQSIPTEAHHVVQRLAGLLCWCKVLTDLEIKSLLREEARVSFADWDFKYTEGQPTISPKGPSDGTYNGLAAIRRLLRAGETPGRTSAYFETNDGKVMFCQATEWPREVP